MLEEIKMPVLLRSKKKLQPIALFSTTVMQESIEYPNLMNNTNYYIKDGFLFCEKQKFTHFYGKQQKKVYISADSRHKKSEGN